MSTWYRLVNKTTHEYICFLHIPVGTKSEIINHPIATALIAYYMMQHPGDYITALSEYDLEAEEYHGYVEVTDQYIDQMVEAQFLIDEGREYITDDESCYRRTLKFVDFDWHYK